MLKTIRARIQQGYRTMRYPDGPPPDLPERFRGRPSLGERCRASCRSCEEVCPTGAIAGSASGPALDTGLCIFCGKCAVACPEGTVSFSADHRLAASARAALVLRHGSEPRAEAASAIASSIFRGSLKLRQVSAGGCGACEADSNVLSTPLWDMGRFGIQFVASPRHADGLLVTGPVSWNMRDALKKTWEAVPEPRLVIAAGACAIGGGPYRGHPEACDGAQAVLPVDLFVPGCPPHPLSILDGLLRFIGRETP